MVSTQGEIRVGPSHQARLPEHRREVLDVFSSDPEMGKEREELRWLPNVFLDGDLLMFLRAARSMAAFAGMCDGGSPDDGCIAASRDDTTINALRVLHESGYDPGKALQALVKCPIPKSIDKKWTEEETKRFIKGLRLYGKNFFRIRKELLPHKETCELVEFYYLWKKTPGANMNRPHRRNRRSGSLRRIRNTRNTRGQPKEQDAAASAQTGSRPQTPKEQGDASSGMSEDEANSGDDSDSRELQYQCRHCFITCRDWEQGVKEHSYLCIECRKYLQRFGELPAASPPSKVEPDVLGPEDKEESNEDSSGRMQTRTRTKEQNTKTQFKEGAEPDTSELEMDKKSTVNSVEKKKKKSDSPHKGRKRASVVSGIDKDKELISPFKQKRPDHADSPFESTSTDGCSAEYEGDNIETESGDNTRRQPTDGSFALKQAQSSAMEKSDLRPQVIEKTTNASVGRVSVIDIHKISTNSALMATDIQNVNNTVQIKIPVVGIAGNLTDSAKEGDVYGVDIKKLDLEGVQMSHFAVTQALIEDKESLDNSHVKREGVNISFSEDLSNDESKMVLESERVGNGKGVQSQELFYTHTDSEHLSAEEAHYAQQSQMSQKMIRGREYIEPKLAGMSPVPESQNESHFSEQMAKFGNQNNLILNSNFSPYPPNIKSEVRGMENMIYLQDKHQMTGNNFHAIDQGMHLPPSMTQNIENVPHNLTMNNNEITNPIPSRPTSQDNQQQFSKFSADAASERAFLHQSDLSCWSSNSDLIQERSNTSDTMQERCETSNESEEQEQEFLLKESENIAHQTSVIQSQILHTGMSQSQYENYMQSQNRMSPQHLSLHVDKSIGVQVGTMQTLNINEPQNLKIKQDVMSSHEPFNADPLQSLKEVKVPGYIENVSPVSQPLISNQTLLPQSHPDFHCPRSNHSSPGITYMSPSVENLNREQENTSTLIYDVKSPSSKYEAQSYTPPLQRLPQSLLTSQTGENLASPSPRTTPTSLPSSIPQPVMHPSQQVSPLSRGSPGHPPFLGPQSHHPLAPHSLFTNMHPAGMHHTPYPHHPYAGYSYSTYPFQFPPMPHTLPIAPDGCIPLLTNRSEHEREQDLRKEGSSSMVRNSSPHSTTSEIPSLSHALPIPTNPPLPPLITFSEYERQRELRRDRNTTARISSSPHSANNEFPSMPHALPVPGCPHPSLAGRNEREPERQSRKEGSTSTRVSSSPHTAIVEFPPMSHSLPIQLPANQAMPSLAGRSVHERERESRREDSSSALRNSSPHASVLQRGLAVEDIDKHRQEISSTHHASHQVHHQVSSEKSSSHHSSHVIKHSQGHSLQHKISKNHQTSSPAQGAGTKGPSPSTPLSLTHQDGHQSNSYQHHSHGLQATDRVSPSFMMGHQHRQKISIGHHPSPLTMVGHQALPPPPMPGSSLEALRAHAQAAANMQQHGQGPMNATLMGSSPLPLTSHHMRFSHHDMEDSIKSEEAISPLQAEDEELPSPQLISRGPSPEPKIEDNECHRSQSAIFLRHWNRGEFNSCTRTDLTFKPVPDTKLARKREERLRKQAEKEREDREKAAHHSHKITTPEKRESMKPPSRGPAETITSPYERLNSRPGYPDTPALRQLSEYARPHAGFSPGQMQRAAAVGLSPQCVDPMIHYACSMYGPGARERLEIEHLEREKREREIRELRERELTDRLKDEMMKTAGAPRLANPIEPHWLEMHRRFPGHPQGPSSLHQYGLYAPAGPGQAALSQLERERLERLACAASAYSRPSLLGASREAMALHHPSELLRAPSYSDQLTHQFAAHEHLKRQILLERERFSHPHLVAQHEEYLRQQREREMKVRALEEAARGSRS